MSKKIYRVEANLDVTEREVVTETEYHWTIIERGTPWAISKSKDIVNGWCGSQQAAIEDALNRLEKTIDYYKRDVERYATKCEALKKMLKEIE